MESFAEILFTFESRFHQKVSAAIRVGKFIGDGDEKFLEIVGGTAHDRTVRFDFVSQTVLFSDGRRTRRVRLVEDEPVGRMIHAAMDGRVSGRVGLFSLDTGLQMIRGVVEFRAPIVAHVTRGRALNGYVAGARLADVVGTALPL